MTADSGLTGLGQETRDVPTEEAALGAANLCKTFKTDEGRYVEAIRNVTVTIERGEFVCVVGPSGHGKSTLLFLFAGLEVPTSGTLVTNGRPINGPGADRGLVFQQDTLFLWKRVADNVGYGLNMRGIKGKARDERVAEYLRLVGLEKTTFMAEGTIGRNEEASSGCVSVRQRSRCTPDG